MNFIKFTTKSEIITSKSIRKKLLFIFFLNISDLLFTWLFVGKYGGLFFEANVMAKNIVTNVPLTFFLKMSIVLLVILYWNYRLKSATLNGLLISNITANLVLTMYIIINLLHGFNLIVLLYTKGILF
ncbi:DUF5658 family protein [uncultured Clostridium sp.]|uniref:DUF5658 family protein n=1 Tax=uncultured Clostridium sp. TaxID=59620 RepID=UPI003217720B